jgi:hypothetical protein
VRIHVDEHTAKAFAYKDKTSIEELHKMMAEKLEVTPELAASFALFERLEDGSTYLTVIQLILFKAQNLLDPQEKYVKILKKWKTYKGETKLMWLRSTNDASAAKPAAAKPDPGGKNIYKF